MSNHEKKIEQYFFLEKKTIETIETILCPGVIGFKNLRDDTAWFSISKNIGESLLRNLKKREYTNIFLYPCPKKSYLQIKQDFIEICNLHKKEGWKITNRQYKLRVRAQIEEDFRDNTKYLVYVYLCGYNAVIKVLGVFFNMGEAKGLIRHIELNGGDYNASEVYLKETQKGIMEEYKQFSLKGEYEKLFK